MENSNTLTAEQEHHGEDELHIVPDRTQWNVFVALICLTAATVFASVRYPGPIGIGTALVVTPLKGALILMYFMHLKFEKPLFMIMFLVALSILALTMGLTIVDYLFR